MNKTEDVINLIRSQSAYRFLILTHSNPDGDAVASSIALSLMLKTLNIANDVLFDNKGIDAFKFLPGFNTISYQIKELSLYKVVIALDTAHPDRLFIPDVFRSNSQFSVNINLDHHMSNTQFAKINLVEDISSIGELLYRLFTEFQWAITPEIAGCLYASILSDTGGFRYANTTAQTLQIASELINLGADNVLLAKHTFESKPFEIFKMIQLALDNLVVNWDLGFCYTVLPKINSDYGQEIIDFIRQLDKINICIVFREYDDRLVRISLRSKNKFDVARFASQFEGGGHKAAAGIKMKGTLAEAVSKVIYQLQTQLIQLS